MTKINKVHFSGRLASDPDLRTTPSGMAVCNVRLLQNSRHKTDSGWEDGPPIPLDVAIWGKRGEAFAKYHSKGDLAYVEGKLRFDQWDDKRSGEPRSKLKLDADAWEFMPNGAPVEADATPDPFGG